MNYVFLGNNRVGWQVLRWLVERAEPPTALVVHPKDKGRFREEIIEASGLAKDRIFEGSALRSTETLNAIKELKAELALSIFFDYILKGEFLAMFPKGCLNLHPALLPYNRGQYPNVWSIIEGTPAGATLHYMDEGIDTGDIVAQREVAVLPTDTGKSLYERLEGACVELFQEAWPLIKTATQRRTPQPKQGGTFHRTKDIEAVDAIDLDRSYTARDLINVLRARTFPPHRSAYFLHNGRRVYLRLSLEEESSSTRS